MREYGHDCVQPVGLVGGRDLPGIEGDARPRIPCIHMELACLTSGASHVPDGPRRHRELELGIPPQDDDFGGQSTMAGRG